MFKLTLVTPEKKLEIDTEIVEVTIPGYRSELNILPGHAPLMTTLTTGVMKYRKPGQDLYHYAAISWGYCQVSAEGVNVLAELAERPSEIDVQHAAQQVESLEKKLGESVLTEEELAHGQREIAMAKARLEAATHLKTSL